MEQLQVTHGFLPYRSEQLKKLLEVDDLSKFQIENWKEPQKIADSTKQARPGYNSCEASEYRDDKETLLHKIHLLAAIIQKSKRFLLYSGAGISTAAGIGDYASRADNSVGLSVIRPLDKAWSEFDAKPTIGHCIFTSLYHEGYLKHWIQQNHDGLPQKAGFPQSHINEIHGSWYDPSNPVVQMSGALRSDLFDLLLHWETSDFCLAVGTSLAGMNADRVVTAAAERAINREEGNFGSAIISVQKTVCDHYSSLRFFCTIDEAMILLANHLQLPIPSIPNSFPLTIDPKYIHEEDVYIIRYYGSDGKRIDTNNNNDYNNNNNNDNINNDNDNNSDDRAMLLDLREDAQVKITIGQFEGHKGEVTGKNKEGHFRLRIFHPLKNNFMAPKVHTLGLWWLYAAVNGSVSSLPIVNCDSSLRFL